MSADSHASKRKSILPKKRSSRKAEEVLDQLKKKKKKVEEVTSPPLPSSDQKFKSTPVRTASKPGNLDGNNSSSATPATISVTMPTFHSNTSTKVFLLCRISYRKMVLKSLI